MSDPQGPRRNVAGTLRYWRQRALPAPRKHQPPRPKTNLTATLRTWHRRAGLFAFIFMAWLGISGFLINQSASWGYDVKRVDWGWVMALYGLHPEPPRTGFSAGGHWLTATTEATLLDGKPLATPVPDPRGFALAGTAGKPLLFVATPDRVFVFSPQGEKIDEMTGYMLPVQAIRRIGTIDGAAKKVVIQDLDAYASVDGIGWDKLAPNSEVQWSQAQALPEAERAKALPYSRPTVSLEHVLVDAHSGRLFGSWGAWVINCVGIAAVALSVTGIWMMYRVSRGRRQAGR